MTVGETATASTPGFQMVSLATDDGSSFNATALPVEENERERRSICFCSHCNHLHNTRVPICIESYDKLRKTWD